MVKDGVVVIETLLAVGVMHAGVHGWAKNASGQSETPRQAMPSGTTSANGTHIFFHPDYTVGPGIAPDLLTLRC
jgi:hypothetical protein